MDDEAQELDKIDKVELNNGNSYRLLSSYEGEYATRQELSLPESQQAHGPFKPLEVHGPILPRILIKPFLDVFKLYVKASGTRLREFVDLLELLDRHLDFD